MKRRNTEMAGRNGTAPIQPLRLGKKDHQHADGDDDQRRQDQKQIGTLRMLAAAIVGSFLGAGYGVALPSST
jgi:hypothetical protein